MCKNKIQLLYNVKDQRHKQSQTYRESPQLQRMDWKVLVPLTEKVSTLFFSFTNIGSEAFLDLHPSKTMDDRPSNRVKLVNWN